MQIFNTMTRRKEEFTPQKEGEYRIYVCGPTVYNYIHIGNARPMIVFDTLRRYLEYCVESGLISIEMLYGNICHPRRLYRKAAEKT